MFRVKSSSHDEPGARAVVVAERVSTEMKVGTTMTFALESQ